MTTFVSTLGFDTSHLHSLLVNEDVENGDHILLVRPEDEDSRGEDAVQDVEGTVDMLDVELTTEVRKFDPEDFEGTTTCLVSVLDRVDENIVVNLAGGDRALIIALAVAVMTTSTEVRSTHLRSDVTRKSQEMSLPPVQLPSKDRDREVLEYVIENNPVSNKQIATMVDKSETTVHRSLTSLEEIGYVEVDEEGGENLVQATFLGNLVSNRL